MLPTLQNKAVTQFTIPLPAQLFKYIIGKMCLKNIGRSYLRTCKRDNSSSLTESTWNYWESWNVVL